MVEAETLKFCFEAHGSMAEGAALNLVSSPDAGKTSLLVSTIERLKEQVASNVVEGEDKPLKYPDIFRAADVMLLNKCDLLPHLDFDADLAEANVRRVNPHLVIFRLSGSRGEGMAAWLDWIRAGLAAQKAKHSETVDHLKQRIAELERQLAAD